MTRSTVIDLPPLVCLVCGLRLKEARIHDGEGFYLRAPPVWHSPRFLDVHGQTCKDCDPAFDEMDPHRALFRFEAHVESLMAEANPEAHRICVEVKEQSHPDVEGQHPSVKARVDRAELKVRGQSEFHTWRQATWAWHVRAHERAHEIDRGWGERFGWITEGYVFPKVTRPLDQRYVDRNLLPRYPDGSTYAGPEGEKEHKAWLEKLGAYAWRNLQPPRLVV